MNYSACWISKKALVSTSDATPLIPGQICMVVIVCSIITKIFNPMQVFDGHISTSLTLVFYLCLLIIAYCQLLFL
jgi:hypothetical protein